MGFCALRSDDETGEVTTPEFFDVYPLLSDINPGRMQTADSRQMVSLKCPIIRAHTIRIGLGWIRGRC